jgi:serine/threonine protein kinase
VVKITDFGIAKAEEELAEATEGGEASLSSSTTALGALPYMAPEMIESSRTAGKPVDIWSLGAILYRLVSGKYPFGSNWGALKKILSGNLPPKPEILFGKSQFVPLGKRLWEIISNCLRQRSNSRPSADDLLAMCAEFCYSDAPRYIGAIKGYPIGKKKAGLHLRRNRR